MAILKNFHRKFDHIANFPGGKSTIFVFAWQFFPSWWILGGHATWQNSLPPQSLYIRSEPKKKCEYLFGRYCLVTDAITARMCPSVCLFFSSLRARSGVAGLVFAFQCMSRRHKTNLLIFFYNLINQEIRAKFVRYWNWWCPGGGR